MQGRNSGRSRGRGRSPTAPPAGRCVAACRRMGYDLPMRSSMVETLLTVRRRCLVCDAETEFVEPEDTDQIGTPCPACHAPTERVATLARRTKPVAANPHAAALGRLGGLKGGPARAARLSPERRREIAIRAAKRRWNLD
jgi:hypothetical protein